MRYRALPAAIAIALLAITRASAAAQTPPEAGPPPAEIQQLITRYTLVEVGGKSLPAVTEKEWRSRKEVTAGTLMLRGDGRWRLETSTRKVCGDRTEDDRDSDDGIYRTEARTMRFFDDDGRENTKRGWSLGTDIDLEEFTTGTIGSDGTLMVRLSDGRTHLLFRRVVFNVMPPASHRQRHRGAAIRISATLGCRACVAPSALGLHEARNPDWGIALRS